MIPIHPTPIQQEYSYNKLLEFDELSFVDEYASYVGLPYISFLNNGSSAIELALRALKIRRGDKIACNIASDLRVVHTIKRFDATPLFLDSDERYYGVSYDAFKQIVQLSKIHTLIIDIPTAGTINIQKLINLAKKNGIKVLLYFNIFAYKSLNLSDYDMAIFSQKDEITSIGVVATINKEYHTKIELQKNQSITYNENSGVDVIDIGAEYNTLRFSLIYYYNYLSIVNTSKDELGFYYHEGFKKDTNIILPPSVDENAIYYFIKLKIGRDTVVSKLFDKQIYTGIGKIPMIFFSYYKKRYNLKVAHFPQAIKNYNQIITLPYYPSLTLNNIREIISTISSK